MNRVELKETTPLEKALEYAEGRERESLSDLGRIMDVRETFEECLGEESLFLYKADWRAVL